MRLLHCKDDGTFELTQNLEDDKLPNYAILSHTWLSDEEEVTFEDMIAGIAPQKTAGYRKLQFCGQQAIRDKLKYFWLDTCCIKKESSSELQEAITTMFLWYKRATRCYVYLTDVSLSEATNEGDAGCQTTAAPWESAFRHSRWFTRGWTLQELLAPASVEFFSVEGSRLGNKETLKLWVNQITGIPFRALRGEDLSTFSVGERFSWTKNRTTKRKEDNAYCLFGIFNVFMPLMYGEGDYAFARLKKEVDVKRAEHLRLDLSSLPVASEPAFSLFDDQVNKPTCLEGTCVELLSRIADWVNASGDNSVFWLRGKAGTGKSTVARTIARTYHDKGQLGATFFFSKGGGDLSNANWLMTTLALQLATRIPLLRRFIYDAHKGEKDIVDQQIVSQWDKLIFRPMASMSGNFCPSPIVLLIDALDECENESAVQAIPAIVATASLLSNVRLRVFITSRETVPVARGFQHVSDTCYMASDHADIPPMILHRDLSLFFESHLSAIAEEHGFEPSWPGREIIDRLVAKSEGLFISASNLCRFIGEDKQLAMSRIAECASDHHVNGGPDQIYIRLLQESRDSCNGRNKEPWGRMQEHILGSVVNLISPLSMPSLATLLDISLDHVKETLGRLNAIFDIPSDLSSPARLHHPTFRDFLLDKNRCTGLGFQVEEKQAHKALADRCIAIMSRTLKRDICGVEKLDTLAEDIEAEHKFHRIPPELQYACMYWLQHYQQSETRFIDNDSVHKFVKEHFLHWLEVMYILGKNSNVPAAVRLYESLLEPDRNLHQLPFAKNARRLVSAFQTILRQAPLQVYCGVLIYASSTNKLKHHFRDQLHPCIRSFRVSERSVFKPNDGFNFLNDLSFTPDGRYIASGSMMNSARLWNVETKAPVHSFEGPRNKVSTVSISPDGTLIAAGSDDFTITVWDLETRTLRYHLDEHSNWVNSLVFSPDGTLLASGSADKTVMLWKLATGEQLQKYENQSGVNSTIFSPDGKSFVTGSVDGAVRLWDISHQLHVSPTILYSHQASVSVVRFSPNLSRLASGSDDETVKLWDLDSKRELRTLRDHTKRVTALSFSANSRLLVSGSDDRSIRVWDAEGNPLHTLRGHTSGINAILFYNSRNILASVSSDDEVRIWDTRLWELWGVLDDFDHGPGPMNPRARNIHHQAIVSDGFHGHSSAITSMVFSPNGQMIASGSRDGTVKVWSTDGKEIWGLRNHSGSINHLVFSPNSCLLASASADQTVRMWNMLTGAEQSVLNGHFGNVLQVVFSPDSQMVASCSTDTTVIIRDVITGERLMTLRDHSSTVNHIIFSPTNQILASCSADGIVALVELFTGHVRRLESHSRTVNAVAFSPDGELLVSGSDDCTLRLWGKDGRRYESMKQHDSPIKSVSFSPDGNLVAYCSGEGAVWIWDLPNLSHTQVESGGKICRVSFSNDGTYILTDRGALSVSPDFYFDPPNLSSSYLAPLFVTDRWVRRGNENLIWIPEEFEVSAVETRHDLIVLGHSSGRISFLNF